MPLLRKSILGILAILLGWSHPLLADQMRGFVNNSSYWWTVASLPRKAPEVGDMTFTLDGVQMGKLGESSSDPIRLAPMSSYMVLYNSKKGDFHHAFTLTRDAKPDPNPDRPLDTRKSPYTPDPASPGQLRFAYDHNALDGAIRVMTGTKVKLKPIEVPPDSNTPVLDTETNQTVFGGDVSINKPLSGELIIHATPNVAPPKSLLFPFVIDATAGGGGWQFGFAPFTGSQNSKGTLEVGSSVDSLTPVTAGVKIHVPPGGFLHFWIKAPADGGFAQALALTHPGNGICHFNISSTKDAYPEDVALERTVDLSNLSNNKDMTTWVHSDRFTLERSIQIIDPAAPVEWEAPDDDHK